MTKRTWQPKKKRRSRRHGFRKRSRSTAGKNILSRRRGKKRSRLTV